MKRSLFCISAVIVLILTFSVSAFAAGTLSVKNVEAKTGDSFTVEVKLSDNPGIIATRIFVDYDTKYLSLENVQNGVVFPASKALFGKDYSEMPYKMLWDDALGSDITTNGNLALLTFKVKAQDPSGKTLIKITVDKSSTFDENLNDKIIGDAVCTVSFPSVSTEKKETTTQQTTKRADTETAKTTAESTALPTATTKKADKTTTKTASSVTSPTTPTASQIQEETLGTTAPVTEKTTAEGTTETKAVTTQGTAETKVSQSDSDTYGTAVETEKAEAAVAGTAESLSEAQTDSVQQESYGNKLNYLWILTVIPVAAVIIILIKKKAGATDVQ